jgi:dTDP-D-glucose 4,6-dehydratase
MNIQEIINRPMQESVSQDEAIFVVKAYVKERKGVDIDPVIDTRTFGGMLVQQELLTLANMYNHAQAWYLKNTTK